MDKSEKDHVNAQIQKSITGFEDVRLLAENKRWSACMNRLYYSVFYLVEALLRKNGIVTKTHNGTKTQFFLHFVKTGLISKEEGKLYSNLLNWRQETDYGDYIDYDEKAIISMIKEAKDLNEHLKKLINEN